MGLSTSIAILLQTILRLRSLRPGLPLRRFFNSSGMKYRELGLKARLDAGMTDQECYELLATDGMLVKRPLLVGDDFAIPGFKEAAWAEALL